jgi:signal peptidase II
LKNVAKKYLFLGAIVAVIVVLDQVTKNMVRNNLAVAETWMPWKWLAPFARIVHWHNDGVVFGLFQGMGEIFTILITVVIVAIIYFYPRIPETDVPLRVALAMQAGGALGNLIDRITQGYVTDFVSVGNFAVFNVADASITLGVAVLLIGLYIDERKTQKKEKVMAEAKQELPAQEDQTDTSND